MDIGEHCEYRDKQYKQRHKNTMALLFLNNLIVFALQYPHALLYIRKKTCRSDLSDESVFFQKI